MVDVDNVLVLVELIKGFGFEMVINFVLLYQDFIIMDVCLEIGVYYFDIVNYEFKDVVKFEYFWQWVYQDCFKEKGFMVLFGCGFDFGVIQVMIVYFVKYYFFEIYYFDIVDCNNGNYGKVFVINFNFEINICEIIVNGCYFENGEWVEMQLFEILQDIYYFNVVICKSYVFYYEEFEFIVKYFLIIKCVCFWMIFGEVYIKYFNVLEGIGMIFIELIEFWGQQIVLIEFFKVVLLVFELLVVNYIGQICIGVQVKGFGKDGQLNVYFVYNVKDYVECYCEV